MHRGRYRCFTSGCLISRIVVVVTERADADSVRCLENQSTEISVDGTRVCEAQKNVHFLQVQNAVCEALQGTDIPSRPHGVNKEKPQRATDPRPPTVLSAILKTARESGPRFVKCSWDTARDPLNKGTMPETEKRTRPGVRLLPQPKKDLRRPQTASAVKGQAARHFPPHVPAGPDFKTAEDMNFRGAREFVAQTFRRRTGEQLSRRNTAKGSRPGAAKHFLPAPAQRFWHRNLNTCKIRTAKFRQFQTVKESRCQSASRLRPQDVKDFRTEAAKESKPQTSNYPRPQTSNDPRPQTSSHPRPQTLIYPRRQISRYPRPQNCNYQKHQKCNYPRPHESSGYPRPHTPIYPRPSTSIGAEPQTSNYPGPQNANCPRLPTSNPRSPSIQKSARSQHAKGPTCPAELCAQPQTGKPLRDRSAFRASTESTGYLEKGSSNRSRAFDGKKSSPPTGSRVSASTTRDSFFDSDSCDNGHCAVYRPADDNDSALYRFFDLTPPVSSKDSAAKQRNYNDDYASEVSCSHSLPRCLVQKTESDSVFWLKRRSNLVHGDSSTELFSSDSQLKSWSYKIGSGSLRGTRSVSDVWFTDIDDVASVRLISPSDTWGSGEGQNANGSLDFSHNAGRFPAESADNPNSAPDESSDEDKNANGSLDFSHNAGRFPAESADSSKSAPDGSSDEDQNANGSLEFSHNAGRFPAESADSSNSAPDGSSDEDQNANGSLDFSHNGGSSPSESADNHNVSPDQHRDGELSAAESETQCTTAGVDEDEAEARGRAPAEYRANIDVGSRNTASPWPLDEKSTIQKCLSVTRGKDSFSHEAVERTTRSGSYTFHSSGRRRGRFAGKLLARCSRDARGRSLRRQSAGSGKQGGASTTTMSTPHRQSTDAEASPGTASPCTKSRSPCRDDPVEQGTPCDLSRSGSAVSVPRRGVFLTSLASQLLQLHPRPPATAPTGRSRHKHLERLSAPRLVMTREDGKSEGQGTRAECPPGARSLSIAAAACYLKTQLQARRRLGIGRSKNIFL